MDKTKMKYCVVTGKNPQTQELIQFPLVTDRPKMGLKTLVEYAKNASFVRGQTKDLEGLLGGFVQAMLDRAKAGYQININDWFILSGRLRGKVDATGSLNSENSYRVTLTPTKELQVNIDNFSWERVDDPSLLVKVTGISYPGAPEDNVIKANQEIVVNGKNLFYLAAAGDKVIVSWQQTNTQTGAVTDRSAVLVPTSSGYGNMKFTWPNEFEEVPVGTEMLFSFQTHGGNAEGSLKLAERKVKVVA